MESSLQTGDLVNFEFVKGTHYGGLKGLCRIENIQIANPKGSGIPLFRKGAKVYTFVQIKEDGSDGVSFRCESTEVIFTGV